MRQIKGKQQEAAKMTPTRGEKDWIIDPKTFLFQKISSLTHSAYFQLKWRNDDVDMEDWRMPDHYDVHEVCHR